MLYAAGLTTLEDIAVLTPSELCQMVQHVNLRQAEQIIKAATVSVKESIDNYMEKIEVLKDAVGPKKKPKALN